MKNHIKNTRRKTHTGTGRLKGLTFLAGMLAASALASPPVGAMETDSLILPPPSISAELCRPLFQKNESLARRDLKTLSNEEKLELASLYYGGSININRDYSKAVSLLEEVLQTVKDPKIRNKALLQKARMLSAGHGYPPNYHEAVRLLQAAEAVDEEDVILELARINLADDKYEEAARLFEKAAAYNNPKASLSLAYLYHRGRLPGGKDRARHFFTLAQNQFLQKIASGDCSYVAKMAEVYERIGTLEDNRSVAARWYLEAAKLDDVEAKLKTIEYIKQGLLKDRDNVPPVRDLLEQAAALGSEEALLRLGKLYLQADDAANADENKVKALTFLEKAAAKGEYEAVKLLVAVYDGRYGLLRNREKLLIWLEKAAQHEDVGNDMLMRYTEVLSETPETAHNEKIFSLYVQAARKEDAEALYNLGEAYRFGIGVQQNPVRAMRYYRQAAQKNHSAAFRRLEQAYSCGIGKEINPGKATIWRGRGAFIGAADTYENITDEIAAAQNSQEIIAKYIPEIERIARRRFDQKSMVFLAVLYQAIGREKEAKKWLDRTIEKDRRAQSDYAGHYAYGKALLESPIIKHDEKKALEYINIAANHGHGSALKKLGDLEKDKGNISEAVDLYEKAGAHGYQEAFIALGRLLEDGRDPARAEELLTHAAQKGEITAMIELAKLKTPDTPRWFKQVLANYPCEDHEILFIVKSYSKGENGAPLDLAKAMEWFNRLVGEGKQEPADLFTLAEILLEAQDNENESKQAKNKDKALSLLQQAHDSGYQPATLKLAGFYMNGTHVDRDTARALSLYQTLAEKGDTEAMYTLGKTYLSGYATEVSPEKARKWLEKAAAGGHQMAAEMLGAMK